MPPNSSPSPTEPEGTEPTASHTASDPASTKRRFSPRAVAATAVGAAAVAVLLISVPVGRGGPLPCKFLGDRVLAALERDLRRTPELWRAFFGAQYTRDAYELARELRRRRNGWRCLADLATVSLQ